ncbi:MAG: cyclic-di-AMP receptor, partial [Candidatus Latescibacteria bacterium]|nr:cyclic-di-AMP receptor [Candidatus Latescibacterota bacterium]
MQLIVAVVQEKDAGKVLDTLVRDGYRATKVSTSGGFLEWGNTTILTGIEDEEVSLVLD